jgi:hypothetical protein
LYILMLFAGASARLYRRRISCRQLGRTVSS